MSRPEREVIQGPDFDGLKFSGLDSEYWSLGSDSERVNDVLSGLETDSGGVFESGGYSEAEAE